MKHMGYELTSMLSQEAFLRDKQELLQAFDPRYVTIQRMSTPKGCLAQFEITVHAMTYALFGPKDTQPKAVPKLSFYLEISENYPAVAPRIYFSPERRLAHVNTFSSGTQCTDRWSAYSTMKIVAEKTIRAVIFDENVTRYDSKACAFLEPWQQKMAAEGKFPTLNPPDKILRQGT